MGRRRKKAFCVETMKWRFGPFSFLHNFWWSDWIAEKKHFKNNVINVKLNGVGLSRTTRTILVFSLRFALCFNILFLKLFFFIQSFHTEIIIQRRTELIDIPFFPHKLHSLITSRTPIHSVQFNNNFSFPFFFLFG